MIQDTWVRKYNDPYGELIRSEREKRRISREALARGIVSKTALENMENGKSGWTKITGDILLHRMGIVSEYFETIASADELERWRLREDICLLIWEKPQEAVEKIGAYQDKYRRRSTIEGQFLGKMEVLLMILEDSRKENGIKILQKAEEVVGCTVKENWKNGLDKLFLSPAELEAILLVAVSLMLCGRTQEAGKYLKMVYEYPRMHYWGKRISLLIVPQTALVGMHMALYNGEKEMAYQLGREAIALLREFDSQRYVLPLLEIMLSIEIENEDVKFREKLSRFSNVFKKMYLKNDCPVKRVWQSVSVENTYEAGLMLKMLRISSHKTRENAVYAQSDVVVEPEHLKKIEKGMHKPSFDNYKMLVQQYERPEMWRVPLIETMSVEALELRKKVVTLLNYFEWEQAELELKKLYTIVDVRYPRVKQLLLTVEGILKLRTGKESPDKCYSIFQEALQCTFPDMYEKNKKWWIYQQEEIMIICNMASICKLQKQYSKAKELYESVLFSLEQQRKRTGIPYLGYIVAAIGYDNLLGDIGAYAEGLKFCKEAIRVLLRNSDVRGVEDLYYHCAWNAYEEAEIEPQNKEIYRRRAKEYFGISEALAEFEQDYDMMNFLRERRPKYLSMM